MRTIYLAGSINGLTLREASLWRDHVRAMLVSVPNVNVIDPTSVYVYSKMAEDKIVHDYDLPSEYVVSSSLCGIERSDIVLAHLGESTVTVGTNFEVGYAVGRDKVVIVSVDKNCRWLVPNFWLHSARYVCEGEYELRLALASALPYNRLIKPAKECVDVLGGARCTNYSQDEYEQDASN